MKQPNIKQSPEKQKEKWIEEKRRKGGNNTSRDERSNQEDKEKGRAIEHKRSNDTNQAERLIRKHYWGKIGLAEYNLNRKIWEFRIDDCEAEKDTTKKISHRRGNIALNTTSDPMPKK